MMGNRAKRRGAAREAYRERAGPRRRGIRNSCPRKMDRQRERELRDER